MPSTVFRLNTERAGGSGFAAILNSIDIPKRSTVVDVGAGGFTGRTTTDPLINQGFERVICVERNPQRCDALRKKYGSRIEIREGPYGELGVSCAFELIVFDIDSPLAPLIYDRLIDFAVEDGLIAGGYLVCLVIYDLKAAYSGSVPPLDPRGYASQAEFMRRYFGSETLTEEIVSAAFANHPGFEFVALVDKYLNTSGPRCVGWTVLRRKG
jgi:hypothetical protein